MSAPTLAELRRRRDEAARVADLVELRLDGVGDLDVTGALAGRTGPVLVTCRPRWEGGAFDGAEVERLALLRQAAERGADLIDVEWRADHAALVASRSGRGIVLSSHDFDGVPNDLFARYRAMRATGAEFVKIAATAHSLADALTIVDLGRAAGGGDRFILLAMGPAGVATRILAARVGSCWTYAGEAVAPGQVPAARLLGEFRWRRLTSHTRLYGIVGRPVGHSVSPAMHNAAFEALGIDAVYLPLEACDADDFVAFARRIGLCGVSVTAPFKVSLLGTATDADGSCAAAGALNTLRFDAHGWQGRNTDMEGFLAPLVDRGVPLSGRRVAVVGTGGAARAVVAALSRRGARISVYGRDKERVRQVASLGGGSGVVGLPTRDAYDMLVNATPVGTWPLVEATPVPPAALRPGAWVYDLVYNPPRTRLCRDARAAGCTAVGGLEMLVAQACCQFEWWTLRHPPREVMRAAAERRLAEIEQETAAEAGAA